MSVVRKIFKQNKETLIMDEVWIFQPDESKNYSDFDCMEWLLREFMISGTDISVGGFPDGSDWHMIPQCIKDMSEERYGKYGVDKGEVQ
jgi:hypothetical protein